MPTAIFSVSDKTGLVEFSRALVQSGWKLLASGGTARTLQQNAIQVTEVSDYTNSPEMLGGRVKTLHPAIHAGLLARAGDGDMAELAHFGWEPIDLAVVNLYPFQQTVANAEVTLDDAIENIDIGGVALIRAAAKNYQRVTLVCDPVDYPEVLAELQTGEVSLQTRQRLAVKGFAHTSQYDRIIEGYLQAQLLDRIDVENRDGTASESERNLLDVRDMRLYPISPLRYGENPHQQATLYGYMPDAGVLGGQVLGGKALSYNNILDLDAAWRAALSFERASVCIVKHLSPCGIACADSLVQAFPAALASDPISAFGGVIAVNRDFDSSIAEALGDLFVECIAAPGFTPEAMDILTSRKNLRLVHILSSELIPAFELRSVNAGVLLQQVDQGDPAGTQWVTVTVRQPSPDENTALSFAWKACQHVKSNAIVFARSEGAVQATVGIGGGQPNRVDCVRIAAQRAGDHATGAVMASDAFFPFPDAIEEAAKVGITAVIAPGGSVRDDQAIAAADKHGMAMIFTGVRHFRH